jgi:hypothetical protein
VTDPAIGPGDPHVLQPGHAPTPFTADEIRRGCPQGRTIRLLVEAEGAPPLISTRRYVSVDEDGATIERERFTADGAPLGDATTERETWLELQAHASFPADRTAITRERIETPLGILECLRYAVTEGSTVDTFWFAAAVPGMPVRYMTEEAGRVTSTVTVIEDTRP